jgi:hypothetical protein
MAQPFIETAAYASGNNAMESLNQAISLGEVAKPSRASEWYEMYSRIGGGGVATIAGLVPDYGMAAPITAIPQQSVIAAPVQQQAITSAQPAPAVIEQFPSYTPAPVMVEKAYSYLPPQGSVPMVAAAPVQAMTMAAPMAAPMPAVMAMGAESVVLDEVGDWLVCEDALGLFYYHSPTAQSHDMPPPELVQYYEMQGVQLAPTGAFGAQAAMVAQPAPMMMAAPATYAVAAPAAVPMVYAGGNPSYTPVAGTMIW